MSSSESKIPLIITVPHCAMADIGGEIGLPQSTSQHDVYGRPPYPTCAYICVGTVGMFLWDFLIHMKDDYRLLLKQRITLMTVGYFWSRLNCLCSVATTMVFFVLPLNEWCFTLGKVMFRLYPAYVVSSSLLLYLCVCAFYVGNRRVITAFSISFLVVTASSAIVPVRDTAAKVAPTDPYCTLQTISTDLRLHQALAAAPLVNNLAVFLAIAIRLMPSNDELEGPQRQSRIDDICRTLRGKHLPELSRTLWRDFQNYMLAFLFTTLLVVIVPATNFFPQICGFILVAPHMAIQNCMICYLIRNIRAAFLKPDRNMDMALDFLVDSTTS